MACRPVEVRCLEGSDQALEFFAAAPDSCRRVMFLWSFGLVLREGATRRAGSRLKSFPMAHFQKENSP